MREILFRGKGDKKWNDGDWYFGVPIQDFQGDWQICDDFSKRVVIPKTVGQYTGLTDKNGKKIFEGDIVKQDYSTVINERYDPITLGFIDSDSIEGHHIGIVKISACKGVGMRNPMSYNDIDGTSQEVNRFVNIACYRCEVIGNTHDNPELLGGDNKCI